MSWQDDPEEWIPLYAGLLFDPETRTWSCGCYHYRVHGKCGHVALYRATVMVTPLEKYL